MLTEMHTRINHQTNVNIYADRFLKRAQDWKYIRGPTTFRNFFLYSFHWPGTVVFFDRLLLPPFLQRPVL